MKRKRKPDSKSIHSSPRLFDSKKKQAERIYSDPEIAALQSRALELYAQDETNAQELGRVLLEVRFALRRRHGAFLKWWKRHKLSQARVSYCMRLAAGKVAAAKIKSARKPERVAMSFVKTSLDGFLKFCINEAECKTLDQVHRGLSLVVSDMVAGISEMRHWPLAVADNEANKIRKEALSKALWNFLVGVFVKVDFDDLERISTNSNGSMGVNELYRGMKKPAVPEMTPVQSKASAQQ